MFRTETLLKRAPDPRDRHGDPDVVEIMQLRATIQRAFTGERVANVKRYKQFIHDIRPRDKGGVGRPGFAPSIILFRPTQLNYLSFGDTQDWEVGDFCFLELDESVEFLAFDGETQLAARHDLFREELPKAKVLGLEAERAVRNEPVAVMIFHGESAAFAQQGFFDANQLRVKVAATIALRNDSVTPSVLVLKDFIGKSPILFGRVEMDAATIRTKDNQNIVTLSSAHIATRAFFAGHDKAVTKDPISEETIGIHRDSYERWFGGVLGMFKNDFLDRTGSILSNQTAWVAIGSTGHKWLGDIGAGLESLRSVDWKRGPHWIGIAANQDGKSANTHKNWKHTFDALANPESPFYTRVRHLSGRVAV